MKKPRILQSVAAIAVAVGILLTGALVAQEKLSKEQNRQMVEEKAQIQTRMNDDGTPMGRGMQFIDEDGNGICDRYEQGQSMRQNMGRGMGHGQHFIDENGDGFCDNHSANAMQWGHRHGGHHGHGRGSMGQGWKN